MLHNTRAHTHMIVPKVLSPDCRLKFENLDGSVFLLAETLCGRSPGTSPDYTSCVRRLFSMLLYELDFLLLRSRAMSVDEALVTLWDKTQIISLFLR